MGLLTLPATIITRMQPLVMISIFTAISGMDETATRMGLG